MHETDLQLLQCRLRCLAGIQKIPSMVLYRICDSAVDAVDLEVHKEQLGLLGNSLRGWGLQGIG